MLSYLKTLGLELKESLSAFFRVLPLYFRDQFIWWPLLSAVLLLILVYLVSDANFQGWKHQRTFKELMEILHPSLLAAGVLVSLLGSWLSRDRSMALMAAILVACLGRELAGQGTSIYLAMGLILCIWYANTHRQQVNTLLQSRWTLSLLAMGFINYACSQLLDRGIIRGIGRLLSQNTRWQPPYASNMEESLETLGGLFLLLAAVALFAVTRAQATRLSRE